MKSTLRRCVLAVLVVGVVASGWLVPAVAWANSKVDVCHRTGNGGYHTISVASQAVQAHRRHGDALPGEAVPGQPGFVFDAACTAVPASSCPCDFSLAGLAAVGIDGNPAHTFSWINNGPDFAQLIQFSSEVSFGGAGLQRLSSGSYHCRLDFQTAPGNKTVVQEIFTVSPADAQACHLDLVEAACALGAGC